MGTIELWVVVDINGDSGIGQTQEDAMTHYTENIGEIDGPVRVMQVTLSVPLPKVVEISATVPAEAGGATVTVAQWHGGFAVDAFDVNYEDDSLTCDHCSKPIPAAYSEGTTDASA